MMPGAFMTGILPIKKYGTQSAVSDFIEYTMTSPGDFAEYIGFTETEVKQLCDKYNMSFDEAKKWYDGLKQDIISLLGFGHVSTDIDSYQNDMTSINNKDDVLTLLVQPSLQ